MIPIYEIRLTGVDEEDIFQFFFLRLNNNKINKLYVSFHKDFSSPSVEDRRLSVRVFGWGIYTKEDLFIGQIKIEAIASNVIVSFEVVEKTNVYSVLDFVEIVKRELSFSGIKISGSRNLIRPDVLPGNKSIDYAPKNRATLEKWKIVYSIILEMKEEETNSDLDEFYIPKLADFRERLRSVMKKEYSEKTISRIIKAGEAGLLS